MAAFVIKWCYHLLLAPLLFAFAYVVVQVLYNNFTEAYGPAFGSAAAAVFLMILAHYVFLDATGRRLVPWLPDSPGYDWPPIAKLLLVVGLYVIVGGGFYLSVLR
jgi:hypothetical protein